MSRKTERAPSGDGRSRREGVAQKARSPAASGTYRVRGKAVAISPRSASILRDSARSFKGALRRLADK